MIFSCLLHLYRLVSKRDLLVFGLKLVLQVLKGDGLPEQVCIKCAQEMNRAFLFRKLCEKSDATLRHYMQTLLPLPIHNTDIPDCFLKVEDKSFNGTEDEIEGGNERCRNISNHSNDNEDGDDDKLDIGMLPN